MMEVVQRPRLRQQMATDPQAFLDIISSLAVHVPGELTLSGASRDPKDDKFLACAIEGQSDYIITGDDDLLSLTSFRGISIIRPADFIRVLDDLL